MTSAYRALAALGILGLLTACGARAPQAVESSPPPAPAEEPLNLALAPPPAVPGEGPRRPISADVAGKSAAEVRALFGAPTLLRREPPAEVWQFVAEQAGCVLLLTLYPAETGAQMRVSHAQTLPRSRSRPVADADCIAALLKVPPPTS